jgi:outer membrane lipoprotein-sorting protein
MTLTFAIAAVAMFAASDAPSAPDASLDAFFTEFAKKRDEIYCLEARFTQQNISPEETVDSNGAIVYVKPRHIVLRYEKPQAGVTYLMHGRSAYEYQPDIKQLDIYRLEDNPQTAIFFLGFDDNPQALREGYNVSLFETNDKPVGSKGINLRPKKAEDSHFTEVKLFLRDVDYLPYKIEILNEDNSKVETVISDFVINGKLDSTKTQIKLPEGVKIIDDDQVVETVGAGGKMVPEENVVVVAPLAEPKPVQENNK